MANPSKAKGTAWETAVVRYLQAEGFPAARRNAQAGAADIGDIGGLPHFAIEAKDHGTLALAEWVRQANVEAANAGADFGAVVAKRRRAPVEDAYVVMDLATFARVLQALVGAEQDVEAMDRLAVLDALDDPDGVRAWVYVEDVEEILRRGLDA